LISDFPSIGQIAKIDQNPFSADKINFQAAIAKGPIGFGDVEIVNILPVGNDIIDTIAKDVPVIRAE
jgi:hypothetical protein